LRSCIAAGALVAAAVAAPGADHAGPRIGVMVDAGVPDGFVGALAYQPWRRLQLHVGAGHNTIGAGVRGGMAFRFARGGVSPLLAVEVGRYFPAEAGAFADMIDASSPDERLEAVGYDFASAQLGLELGDGDRAFYVQFGVSAIRTDLYFAADMDGAEVRSVADLDFATASGRAGLLLWF
jgi:hypothetical protein